MISKCMPVDGMICRRLYPGQSACTRFGGGAKCLKDGHEPAGWINGVPVYIEYIIPNRLHGAAIDAEGCAI